MKDTNKIRVIDYKKERDDALKSMVWFKKIGDDKMAEAYLNLAVRLNQLRTDIKPILITNY
ncbi:MAG TPA: hypothetical protein ENI23_01850 [bacterium]|nr:hypothetical protein [bacterium]